MRKTRGLVKSLLGRPAKNRLLDAWILGLAPLFGGCGTDENLTACSLTVRASVEQLQVTHAAPDSELVVVDATGREVARGKTDSQGSLVFRKLAPGKGYGVRTSEAATSCTPSIAAHATA